METTNWCHKFCKSFWGQKKSFEQLTSPGENWQFLMKGKSMSWKKLLRWFLGIQALYSRAVRVLLWEKAKEHLLNKNELIDECYRLFSATQSFLSHSPKQNFTNDMSNMIRNTDFACDLMPQFSNNRSAQWPHLNTTEQVAHFATASFSQCPPLNWILPIYTRQHMYNVADERPLGTCNHNWH